MRLQVQGHLAPAEIVHVLLRALFPKLQKDFHGSGASVTFSRPRLSWLAHAGVAMSGTRTVKESGICAKGAAIAVGIAVVLHYAAKLVLFLSSLVA